MGRVCASSERTPADGAFAYWWRMAGASTRTPTWRPGVRATPPPWWLVLGRGAAFPVAALVLLTQPGADHLLTLLALLAVCWLAAAALDLADLWRDRTAWGWKLAGAAAAATAAGVVLRQPLWSTLLVPAA